MIWLITGSRHAPRDEVARILTDVWQRHGAPDRVLHGACAGADIHAADFMIARGVYCVGMPALWQDLGPKKAGPLRNAELLRDAIDLATIRHERLIVIAMPGPESKGTHDMLARVRKAATVFGGPEIHIHIQEVSK